MSAKTSLTRRNFLTGSALLAGAFALPSILKSETLARASYYHFKEKNQPAWTKEPLAPGEPGKDIIQLSL